MRAICFVFHNNKGFVKKKLHTKNKKKQKVFASAIRVCSPRKLLHKCYPLFFAFFSCRYLTRSSCPDYTSVDQLHDLSPHSRVLHMVLQRLRVTLGLLQYTLHHRVSHDFLQKSPKNSSASCRARITSVKKNARQSRDRASHAPSSPAPSHSRAAH